MDRTDRLEDRYIKVGEVNTRYWQIGDAGSTVILLHGSGGYIELWKHNIYELAKYHRVYAFDMVGAGRSDKPDVDYTFDFMAQFTRDFMKALDISHASLIGASAGGGVVLTFALNFPQAIDLSIVVGSAGLGKEVSWLLRLSTLPLLGDIMAAPSRFGMKMLCRQTVYDPTLMTDEIVEEFYQMAMLPGATAGMLNVSRSNLNVWGQFSQSIGDRLSTITSPTLIIWGRQDPMVPVNHGIAAAQKIPHAQLAIIEKCGHWSSIEHPQQFNRLVLDFLARS
jgi:pimeloyl-ACP methyl ester carboxylesterase